MTIEMAPLIKLIKKEIKTHDKENGYRHAVTVDRATLNGIVQEFEAMYNFLKTKSYNHENNVKYAIRGFIADQRDVKYVYKKVLSALLDELS